MSRDGCRQSYVTPVKYKFPKEAAQQAHEVMQASLILLDKEHGRETPLGAVGSL